VSESAHPPITFSTTNALWTVEIPPGHSSPCVWGAKIFLTAFHENKLECRAYDRATGKALWTKVVPADKIEKTQEFNNPAAPTPVADAKCVIFYFGSYGLLACSHDGTLLWEKKLPMQVSRGEYGSGSSPVLCGDFVVQALDTDDGGSHLLALKRATGETAWDVPRPLFKAGWSTPIVWPGSGIESGKNELVVLGSKKLTAYDSADGKELWSVPGFPNEPAPSLAFDEKQLYVCSAGMGGRSNPEFGGVRWSDVQKFDASKEGQVRLDHVPDDAPFVLRPELPLGHPGRDFPVPLGVILKSLDTNKSGIVTKADWDKTMAAFESMDKPVLMALRLEARTDNQRISWQVSRGIPEVPSPLCYQGRLFLIRNGGLLQCYSAESGTPLYQERIGVAGGYFASPIGADGRVYLASESGTITVVDARADKLALLSQNAIGEQITATPALAEDKLYVRTDKHLFAFGTRTN
jgi:outer membrane protein assembly factor BamB